MTPNLSNESRNEHPRDSADDPSIERVYIGGLDPPRLTVEMVAERLTSLDGVDVLTVEPVVRVSSESDDDCRKFFFLTARLRRSNVKAAGDVAVPFPSSAFEAISKKYNNVQWRGCRLRVEPARLHFLERLRLEREEKERNREEQRQAEEINPSTQIQEKQRSGTRVGKVPRNLRIRRRFGEEAFSVDTKPVTVSGGDGWSGLRHVLEGMQKKREKHRQAFLRQQQGQKGTKKRGEFREAKTEEAVGSLNSKHFLNRAVHIRFGGHDTQEDDGGSDLPQVDFASTSEEEMGEASISDSSSTGRGSLESGGDDDGNSEHTADVKISSYVWSDDEDEEKGSPVADGESKDLPHTKDGMLSDSFYPSKSEMEPLPESTDDVTSRQEQYSETRSIHQKNTSEAERKPPADAETAPQKHADHDSNSSGKGCDDSKGNRPRSSFYAWSDDEESSMEDADTEHVISTSRSGQAALKCTGRVDEHDEFSAAFDYSKDEESEKENIDESDDGLISSSDGTVDLDKDVRSNLEVLAKLFPDMAGNKPHLVSTDAGEQKEGEQVGNGTKNQCPGWGRDGLMQRYDPTKASAEKYEVVSYDKVCAAEQEKENEEHDLEQDNSVGEESEDVSVPGGSDLSESGDVGDNSLIKEKDSKDDGDSRDGVVKKPNEPEIYEQKKLESIFQAARSGTNAGGSFQLSGLFHDRLDDSKALSTDQDAAATKNGTGGADGTGFSFSFNIGEQSKPSQHADGSGTSGASFGFSFDVGGGNEALDLPASSGVKAGLELAAQTANNADNTAAVDETQTSEEENAITLKKRRGMWFPQNVLDDLESSFFNMNEGVQVMEDWEAMKSDEASQSVWMEERKSLTLDWKRKLKYATSKKQKKTKI